MKFIFIFNKNKSFIQEDKYIYSLNKDNNIILVDAACNGNINIVKLMLEKGATNYDWAMANASENGHMDIVELMLEKGATDYDGAMFYASVNRYKNIVKLIEKYKNSAKK